MTGSTDTEIVTTVIAGLSSALSPALLKDAVTCIEKSGGKSIRTAWLEEAKAADIFCMGLTADNLRALLADYLKDQPLDVIVQPAAGRRKKFLIADMESTIIEQEMIDELADTIGRRDEVAAITRRAMNGEVDFAGALRERVAMLKGQPAAVLDRVAERITFMPGARALISTMKAQGAVCWLVSGGFTCFAGPVASLLGFDEAYANILIVRDGIITGEVVEPFLDKDVKKALFARACGQLGLSPDETLAVGDGANDIPMLAACNEGGGLGVAYRAKPHVREAIPNQVNHAGLTALLYAQGYGPNTGISDPSKSPP